MNHGCKDIDRDAAVRAAEDNRTRPLPTLGDCIDGMFPKSVSASSAVEQKNKGDGMAADGLRTERVVIEVTGAPGWRVHVNGIDVESVRVVEEAHFDDLAQVAMERDAAIRERDKAQARVAELEADVNDCNIILGNRWRDAVSVVTGKAAQAASGGGVIRDMTDIVRSETADADEKHAALATLVEAVCPGWALTQAASGGGEPVANVTFHADDSAERARYVGMTVKPLRRPQPRGWLTGEEKAAIRWAMSEGFDEEVLCSLLARSSPPEVVLPVADCSWCCDYATVWRECLKAVRSSLAAAGVAVKEVGHE